MTSRVERDLFISKASEKLSINKKSFESDVNRLIRRKNYRENKEQREELYRQTSGISDRVNRDFAKYPKAARIEENVLGMMLCRGEFIHRCAKNKTLCDDDFITEFGKKLFGIMMGAEENGGFDFSILNESLTQDEVSRAQKLMTDRMSVTNTDDVFDETASALRTESEKYRIKATGETEDLSEKIKKLRETKR